MKGRISKNLSIEDNYFPDKFWDDLKKFTKENLKRTKKYKICADKKNMHKHKNSSWHHYTERIYLYYKFDKCFTLERE